MAVEYTTGPPVSRPGIKAAVLSYPEIADADELETRVTARLATLQAPDITYRFAASDLSRVRNSSFEVAVLGEIGRAVDADLGLVAEVQLREIRRSLTNPLDTVLVFETHKREIEDRLADLVELVDDYTGPTEELPADKVLLPDGGTVDDWVGDNDEIDGQKIQEGTIDRLELARVISRTDTSPEEYTVELLDPGTRTPTGSQLTEVFTADNENDLIATNTEVLVLIRSDAQVDAGEHHVIIRGGGSGTNYYITAPSLTFTGTGF